MKETLRQAGYKYKMYLGNKKHLLLEVESEKLELFASNKGHASWGLIYKNTHLEFVSSWRVSGILKG
jgi:hypothetical protein